MIIQNRSFFGDPRGLDRELADAAARTDRILILSERGADPVGRYIRAAYHGLPIRMIHSSASALALRGELALLQGGGVLVIEDIDQVPGPALRELAAAPVVLVGTIGADASWDDDPSKTPGWAWDVAQPRRRARGAALARPVPRWDAHVRENVVPLFQDLARAPEYRRLTGRW